MSAAWFATAGGRQHGPFTDEQLLKLVERRQIAPTDMVRQGSGPWVPAGEVEGLFRPVTAQPIATPHAPAMPHVAVTPSAPPTAPLPAVPMSAVPVSATPQALEPAVPPPVPHPQPHAHPQVRSHGKKRSSGNERLPVTAASILVGAAAAVVIYINLEGLENRIFHRTPQPELPPPQEVVLPLAEAPTPAAVRPPDRRSPEESSSRTEAGSAAATNAATAAATSTSNVVLATPLMTPTKSPTATASETSATLASAAPPATDAAKTVPTADTAAPKFSDDAWRRIRNGLVTVRTADGRTSPGLLVDEAGHVAAYFVFIGSASGATQMSVECADGTKADVAGYSAALPGKRLVLLETGLVGRKPLPIIGPGAQAGKPLHVVSNKPPEPKIEWSIAAPAPVDMPTLTSQNLMSETMARFYDRNGSYLRLDHPSRGMLPGEVLFDDHGEIAAVRISTAKDPAVSIAVGAEHLVELLAAVSGTVAPFSELRGLTVRDGAVTIMTGSPSRGFPGARPGFGSPPSSRSIVGPAPSGSMPGPAAVSGGAVSSAPSSTAPSSTAPSNSAAATSSTTTAPPPSPGSSSPASASATSGVAGPLDPQQWIARMKELDVRKAALLSDRDAIMREYEPLEREADGLRAELRTLGTQAARVKRSYSSTVKDLEDLLQLRDVGQKVSSVAISSLQSQASALQSDFQILERQAAPKEQRLKELAGPIEVQTKKLDLLYVDAERLRKDFFDHVAPFGPTSPERGEAAVHYFTGVMPSSGDTSYAKFGLGCGNLAKGDYAAALTALDAAVALQPKDPMFLAVRGLAKVRNGDDAGGRKDLADALKADPKCYLARYLLSISLLQSGTYSAAESQIREALKVDPAHPDGLRLLALLKCACDDDKMRKADYALKNAQQAYDAAPNAANMLVLAAALADNGKFDEAVAQAERAVAAVDAPRAAWYRECLQTFQAKQPLRLNFKGFDYLAKL